MNRLYRSILAAFLLVAILLTASGCGGGDTQSTGKTKLPMQTEGNETNQPEATEPSQTNQPETTEPSQANQPETTEPSQPEQGLTVEQLRQQMSAENKTFALAIVDGQLVLRNYFAFDGVPGVSYETFQRVG